MLTSAIRGFAKSCAVSLLGRETRPRKIFRGLASGYWICVSPVDHLGYLLGTTEPHLQRSIKEYVAVGDTVYDIGANIGYVSLSLAKSVGPSGRVIAFEPVPKNAAYFRESIKINRLANVQLLEFAAADQCGETVIRVADSLSTASLIWHREDPSATQFTIRTLQIDQLVDAGDLGYPRFVKIDVEGAEGSVLKGMERTVAAARPVLFIECSEAGRETTWTLLKDLGYNCQSAISRKQVDSLDEYRHSDFLWLPTRASRIA
jgi:FkbM family methyltransferase